MARRAKEEQPMSPTLTGTPVEAEEGSWEIDDDDMAACDVATECG